MNLLKKLSIVLAVILVFAALPSVAVFADSGSCGDNLSWRYDSSSAKLTISGSGEMYYSDIPWVDYINKIKTVVVGEKVTSIECNFVCGAEKLTSLTLGQNLEIIDDGAFQSCTSLKTVVIPESVVSIGASAFLNCKALNNITFSANTNYIGFWALNDTAWYNAQSNGAVYAGNVLYAYKGDKSKLTSFSAKSGTLGISDYVFENSVLLKNVTLPKCFNTIGNGAFSGCLKLESISSIDNAQNIGMMAFYDCKMLKSVSISAAENIGEMAFFNCASLETVEISEMLSLCDNNAFDNTLWYNNQPQGAIYIGKCFYKFKGTYSSETFTVKSGTTCVCGYSLYKQSSITKVILPESIKYIGDMAFSFTSVKTTNIPDNVLYMGAAFYGNDDVVLLVSDTASYGCFYALQNKMSYRTDYHKKGDANGNNTVTVLDLLIMKKHIVNIRIAIDLSASDVNGDGKINIQDMLMVKKHIVGIIVL